MKAKKFNYLCTSLLILLSANVHAIAPPPTLRVQILADNASALPEYYAADLNVNDGSYRAYIQAKPKQRYKIQLNNPSNQRVGVVVAVDGRNVISGARSDLANNERMYILDPGQTATVDGWRSSQNTTQRFFFTESNSSYAAAWGDKSAMGVIAVAAYHEKQAPPPVIAYSEKNQDVAAEAANAIPAPTPMAKKSTSQAGTGYGENSYSPTTNVEFEAEAPAFKRYFYKYEWKQALCDKHILPVEECPKAAEPANRFWPSQEGYAPPPPIR
jgi:hypothetical protein